MYYIILRLPGDIEKTLATEPYSEIMKTFDREFDAMYIKKFLIDRCGLEPEQIEIANTDRAVMM